MRFRLCVVFAGVLFVLIMFFLHSKSLLTREVVGYFTAKSSMPFNEHKVEDNDGLAFNSSATIPVLRVSGVRRLQEHRKRTLQSICRKYGLGYATLTADNIGDIDLSRIYVDEKYRLLYCEVPKVACTNWKRILLILTGKMNTTDPEQLPAKLVHTKYQKKYLRTLQTYKPAQILAKIRDYYKFMFVREPLERIVSAYMNKFKNPFNKMYPRRYGRKIIGRFRKNATDRSLESGDDVRFGEFVQYLLHLKINDVFDVHWRPFHQICHPCLINYDFVGKYETLKQDVDFILGELGVKHLIHFPEKPPNNVPKTADILKTMYANVSSEDIHNLWRLYSVDYSLFNYPYPDLRKR